MTDLEALDQSSILQSVNVSLVALCGSLPLKESACMYLSLYQFDSMSILTGLCSISVCLKLIFSVSVHIKLIFSASVTQKLMFSLSLC